MTGTCSKYQNRSRYFKACALVAFKLKGFTFQSSTLGAFVTTFRLDL